MGPGVATEAELRSASALLDDGHAIELATS
jgi:hypothetical protein